MKKNLFLSAVLLTSLVLVGCGETSQSSETSNTSVSTGTSDVDPTSSSITSSSPTSEDPTTITTPTSEITADEAWQTAINKDYSNSTCLFYESLDGTQSELTTEYNVDGYNVIYDVATSVMMGEAFYQYYHDYEEKSYTFFSDATYGDAWINSGYKGVDLSIENTWFDLLNCIEVLKDVPTKKVQYGLEGNPLFYITDETTMESLNSSIFGYSGSNIAQFEYVALGVDSNLDFMGLTAFLEYGSEKTYLSVSVSDIGSTQFTYEELPPAPTKDTVKTYYEWIGEEPRTEKNITSITLTKDDSTAAVSIESDSKVVLKSTFLPADANTYTLSAVSEDENIVTINHASESGSYEVFGVHEGTTNVYIIDAVTNIVSNKIAITVGGVKTPVQQNPANTIRFNAINDDLTLSTKEMISNATAISAKALDEVSVDVREHSRNSDLATTLEDENVLLFMPGTVNHMESTVEIDAGGQDIKGISFLYGAEFLSHVDRKKTAEARIYTSQDGTTWDLALDWSEELRANLSGYNMKLFEMTFENTAKYVRIQFDKTTCDGAFYVATQEISLYKKEVTVESIDVSVRNTKVQVGKEESIDVTVNAIEGASSKYDIEITPSEVAEVVYDDLNNPSIKGKHPGIAEIKAIAKADESVTKTISVEVVPCILDNNSYVGTFDKLSPGTYSTTSDGEDITSGSARFETLTGGYKNLYISYNGLDEVKYYCSYYDSTDGYALFTNDNDESDVKTVTIESGEISIVNHDLSGFAMYLVKSVHLESISIVSNVSSMSINVGETMHLSAKLNPINTNDDLVYAWTIEKTSVVGLVSTSTLTSEEIDIEGLAVGTSKITLTVNETFVAEVTVTINEAQTSIPAELVGSWADEYGNNEIKIDSSGNLTIISEENGYLSPLDDYFVLGSISSDGEYVFENQNAESYISTITISDVSADQIYVVDDSTLSFQGYFHKV